MERNFISLDEHEKKLIAQGDIITREIDAVEVKAGAQDNGAQLLIKRYSIYLAYRSPVGFRRFSPHLRPNCSCE